MKQFLIVLFLNFAVSSTILSQISPVLPISSSIAQTSVADKHNWSGFTNPAMLGYLQKPQLGFQIENKFLLKELSTKSAQLGFSSSLINTGISFSHFGYSKYHEMIIGLGFSRNFSNKFSLGVQGNYYTSYFSSTNSYRSVFFPQVGLSVNFTEKFGIGFSTSNPFQSEITTEYYSKRIPSIFSLGSNYFFTPDFSWRTQIDKEVSSTYRFATGFDYQMLEKATVKLGIYGSDYLVPCLGLGMKFGLFVFDLNCELHPLLGLNTLGAIRYQLGK